MQAVPDKMGVPEVDTPEIQADQRFVSLLAPVLPKLDSPFTFIHLKSNFKKCRKLIFTGTKDPVLDTSTSHLFILAYKGMDILALEIYVYEAADMCTVFVSKADTSGYYEGVQPLNIRAIVREILKGLLLYYVPVNKKLRICLFAKTKDHYLFPGSQRNPKKHLLSDAKLVRWWATCLDELKDQFSAVEKCCLQMPGIPNQEAKSYLPPDATLPWTIGDIFWRDSPTEKTLAVKCIPRFPDDPKHTFLDCLVHEKRAKKVSRQQFWEEMQARQEFRLGHAVGVLGVEGTLKNHATIEGHHSISNKEMQLFRNCLYDLNYDTREAAESSSEILLSRTPEDAVLEIPGEKTDFERKRKPETAPVNVLMSGLVRKKKKT